MTTERELTRLLRSNERPRQLSDQEMVRLRTRLGLNEHDGSQLRLTAAQQEPTRDSLSRGRAGDPTGRASTMTRQRAVLAIAAAALVIVVVSVLRSPAPTRVDTTGPTAASTNLASLCSTELEAISAALEEWNGVGPWALATKATDPDLGALVLTALSGLEERGLIDEEGRLVRQSVEDALGSPPLDPAGPGADRATVGREQGVRDGVVYLRDRLTEYDTGGSCDLERFGEAIELGR